MRTDFGQSTTFASRVTIVIILLQICIASEFSLSQGVYTAPPQMSSRLQNDSDLLGAYVPSRQYGEIPRALEALAHSKLGATHLISASLDGHGEALRSSLAFGTRHRRLRAHSGQLSFPTCLLSGEPSRVVMFCISIVSVSING